MRRRLRLIAVLAGLAVMSAVIGVAVLGRPRAPAAPPPLSTATAAVTRGTVTERVQVPGVLTFDAEYPVVHQGDAGVVTSIPRSGTVIGRDGALYAVANRDVVLLFGAVPAYRDMAEGVPAGPDVKELEENLAALGLQPGDVDGRFTAATAAAVRRWQVRRGEPPDQRSGTVPLGRVVFAPGPLRVGAVQVAPGTPVASGEKILTATSTNRVVVGQVPVDRQYLVRAGDAVQVTIGGLTTPIPGTVREVSRIATSPTGGNDGGGGSPTVPVIVRVDPPAGVSDLDQVPVLIAITAATREDVLMVPVVALLPRPGSGYQVRLASGEFVDVQPGLFDSDAGTVEVTGALTEGQRVQVPAG